MAIYNYASINLETLECVGVMTSPNQFNRTQLISIDRFDNGYLGKYYYDNTWWERIWNEYETITHTEGESTWTEEVPVESSGYVDRPWTPSN